LKRLLQIFGLVLAVVWLPITSHCAWENLPGLPFFQCATGTPQDSDCEDDWCAQLETATYKVADTSTVVPVLSLALSFQVPSMERLPAEQSSPVTAAPPEVPAGWQFSFRTALPPRAPSLVS